MDHDHQHVPVALHTHATKLSILLEKAVAGGFAGSCSTIVGHPFDTVTVRMQIDNKHWINQKRSHLKHNMRRQRSWIAPHRFKHLRITITCATQILRNEGLFGYYKGMLFPLLSSIPWTAATFIGYTVGERLFESMSSLPPRQFSNQKVVIAGFSAGFFSSFIACPIDRVKCLLQAQTKSARYHGPFHCALQVYKQAGLFYGNFKGFGITLLRRIPGFAVHFIVYENIKEFCRKRGHNSKASGVEMLFAGGIAGMASCLYWIAPDTIKARIQTAQPGRYPHGMRSVIREMIQRGEPVTALFRGLPPALMRSFPSTAVYMFSYEVFLQYWYNDLPK
ncbi:congested-like trachea protein [Amphiura filiformis]|uniref:congested-like trachea protein n=1 Tax=Amphiura filiformis TaxID=82378 RepID=UPI003B2252C5